MKFPEYRPRRLRRNENLRRMVRETKISADDLVYPLFAVAGKGIKKPIDSMPGIYNLSVDLLLAEVQKVSVNRIPAVIIFGIPEAKDSNGTAAYDDEGVVQQAVRSIKSSFPDMVVITDVCLCAYTDHGHCGLISQGSVQNDPTLDLLARTAVSHARAGADLVAPSDMMDGRVAALRKGLDREGYLDVAIMSYAVKYSSAFYGPFREAAGSVPQFGDRRSYQMDPPNSQEAIREAGMDIEEGCDIIMVKPAFSYLDIVRRLKDKYNYPLAVYNVSGEYAMVKAASQKGWIDERNVVMESLTGIKRAGADLIISYHALEAACWIKEG